MGYFAYLTNNFDLEKLEIYEKTMASDLLKEWAEAIKQERDLLILNETQDLIFKANIQLNY